MPSLPDEGPERAPGEIRRFKEEFGKAYTPRWTLIYYRGRCLSREIDLIEFSGMR